MGLCGVGFSQPFASRVPSRVPSSVPSPLPAVSPAMSPAVSPAMCHLSVLCLSRPLSHSPSPSAPFGQAPPVESGREDAPCPVLRWYPHHLPSSKTPLQPSQSRAGLWVQSACLAFPVPPRWRGGESWLLPRGHLLQGRLPVPGPLPGAPRPAPPRALRITSAVSSGGICSAAPTPACRAQHPSAA